MAVVATCPSCGLENSPMNAVCDSCGAKLDAALAPPRERPLRPWGVFLASLGITFGLALAAAIADLPAPVAGLATFYGPLIATWRATSSSNQVPYAAFGAVGGVLALLVCGAFLAWETTKAVLYAAISATQPDDWDGIVGTPLVIAVAFGSVVIAAAVLPAGLVGATVGDVLARRRR